MLFIRWGGLWSYNRNNVGTPKNRAWQYECTKNQCSIVQNVLFIRWGGLWNYNRNNVGTPKNRAWQYECTKNQCSIVQNVLFIRWGGLWNYNRNNVGTPKNRAGQYECTKNQCSIVQNVLFIRWGGSWSWLVHLHNKDNVYQQSLYLARSRHTEVKGNSTNFAFYCKLWPFRKVNLIFEW